MCLLTPILIPCYEPGLPVFVGYIYRGARPLLFKYLFGRFYGLMLPVGNVYYMAVDSPVIRQEIAVNSPVSHFFALQLKCVETDFNAPAEFADHLVVHLVECPVKQPLCKFVVANNAKESGNTNEGVNLPAIENPANFDFPVRIYFFCRVTFHFFFRVTARPGS